MGFFGWLVLGVIVAFVIGTVFLELRNRRTEDDRHPPDPDVQAREAKRDAEKGEWGGF
jgi:hypothetical protein